MRGTLELMVATLQTLGIDRAGGFGRRAGARDDREQSPDAVILDLVMPGHERFDLLHALRAPAALQRLPVFVWTSMHSASTSSQRSGASAQAVVGKVGGGLDTLVSSCAPGRRSVRSTQARRR